jgi:hypothetical protein
VSPECLELSELLSTLAGAYEYVVGYSHDTNRTVHRAPSKSTISGSVLFINGLEYQTESPTPDRANDLSSPFKLKVIFVANNHSVYLTYWRDAAAICKTPDEVKRVYNLEVPPHNLKF